MYTLERARGLGTASFSMSRMLPWTCKTNFFYRYSLSVTLLITGHFLVYRFLREGHDGGASPNHGLRVGKKRLRRLHVMHSRAHPLATDSDMICVTSEGVNVHTQWTFLVN
jgi:hypothetical protein